MVERDFALLFGARTISAAGSALTFLALGFAVIEAGGSPSQLGLVIAAGFAPQLVLLLVAGVWADRLPRHLVMVAANVLSAAAQATAGILLLSGQAEVWHLLVLALLNGTAFAFFAPASSGVVPELVSTARLQQANALLGMSGQCARLLGLALGGAMIAALSPGAAFIVDALSYLAAAAFVAAIRLPRRRRRPERARFLAELADGWHEVRSRRWLLSILIQFGLVNAITVNAFFVLGPYLAEARYDGASGWGGVLALHTIGMVIGGAIALRITFTRPLLAATVFSFLMPVRVLVLALGLSYPMLAASSLAGGIGTASFIVLWETTVQREIPADRLSRVASYDWLFSLALAPLGAAALGPLAALIGVEATLWASGLLALVAAAAVLVTGGVRSVRTEPAPEAPAPAMTG